MPRAVTSRLTKTVSHEQTQLSPSLPVGKTRRTNKVKRQLFTGMAGQTSDLEDRSASWTADGSRGFRESGSAERGLRSTLFSTTALNSASTVRVALYARYSSDDLQNARSIPDQFLYCREYADRQPRWKIVCTYHDDGISGDSVLLRPGIQALLEAARRREFEIVLVEDLDRVSRRASEMAAVFERLSFMEVKLYEVGSGEVDEMRAGFKGIMSAQFLKNLGKHVHRSQHARAKEGKAFGLASYGYKIKKQVDTNGDPIRGDREIDPAQAEIVIRVLTEYARGVSPGEIAKRLNHDGIPGPSGGIWTANVILGFAQRGTGLLNNELYIGVQVWNHTHKVKNPDTGKYVIRNNPPELWVRAEVPHLRIVSDALWKTVKNRQKQLSAQYARRIDALIEARAVAAALYVTHRPRYPFSGRLICGRCGGLYITRGNRSYACGNHIHVGSCPQARTIRRDELETRVLTALLGPLTEPDVVAVATRAYAEEARRLNQERHSLRGVWVKQLKDTEKRLDEIIEAIEIGGYSRHLNARLHKLEEMRTTLEDRIDQTPGEEVVIPPPNRFREKVENLAASLRRVEERDEAIEALRMLVQKIVITAKSGWRTPIQLTVHGNLATLLGTKDHIGPDIAVIAPA